MLRLTSSAADPAAESAFLPSYPGIDEQHRPTTAAAVDPLSGPAQLGSAPTNSVLTDSAPANFAFGPQQELPEASRQRALSPVQRQAQTGSSKDLS